MSKQLKLKIVTPERLVLEEMVDQVSLPTTLGEITILPDHIPLITGLASGKTLRAALQWGIAGQGLEFNTPLFP